jgi:periplasmic copper chaperone A
MSRQLKLHSPSSPRRGSSIESAGCGSSSHHYSRCVDVEDFTTSALACPHDVYGHKDCGSSKTLEAKRQLRSNAYIFAALAMGLSSWSFSSAAGQGKLEVTDAWVPAVEEVGGDVPLLMTIKNELAEPDALLRARCPVANFYERHTVDRGEGAPAMRAISAIPIPASSTLVLKATEHHIMLLQIRQPLQAGDRFKCSLAFQKAGTLETEVEVRKSR